MMRWVVRGLGLVVILVVLGLGALFLLPSDRIAALAARQFQAATGRAMTITGAVHPTIWPRLGVRTGPVTIANANWSKEGPMLTAKGLSIGVDLGVLIGGTIRVSKAEVLSPKIVLERRKDGTGNWEFGAAADSGSGAPAPAGGAAPAVAQGGGMQAFSLDSGVISDGSVTWIDHATGQRIALSAIDATLAIPTFTGPASLKMTATANGNALGLTGSLGAFADFLAGKLVPVDLTTKIGASTIVYKGSLGTAPMQAQGGLDAQLNDPAALVAVLGQAAPSIPKGLGRDRITVKGQVTLASDGSMHLRDGAVTLDGNSMTLVTDITFPGDRSKIRARIGASALDLSALTSGGGGGAAPAAKDGDGWSTAPIDASALGAADAELALTVSSINLGMTRLGKTRALVTLDNGRAAIDVKELRAYGGLITGQMVVNGRSGLSTLCDLKVKGVAMQPLLTDLAGYKRLTGSGDLSLQLLASGNSEAALARSLSGSGSASFGKGELLGLDLVGMLRNLNLNYMGAGAKTIFDSIGASFTVKHGVLSNDDLAFKAPLVQATGKGTVDIGARRLDYTVTPTALTKADGSGGLSVPLNISGSWDSPKFGLDVKGLADAKLQAGKKKLKDKARAELTKKAQKTLDVTATDSQSLKDAAKQKLQDEAKKGLLNLLK